MRFEQRKLLVARIRIAIVDQHADTHAAIGGTQQGIG
jgi:hypothetical protein